MNYYIVPIVLAIVGVLVLALAVRYYIQDSIYVQKTEIHKRYLMPNLSYFLLAGSWLILSIYLASIIFIQLSA